jgi:hypothetical protein
VGQTGQVGANRVWQVIEEVVAQVEFGQKLELHNRFRQSLQNVAAQNQLLDVRLPERANENVKY